VPAPRQVFSFLNATNISAALRGEPTVAGAAPRWVMRGSVASAGAPDTKLVANIVICDLEAEAALGIGRAWPCCPAPPAPRGPSPERPRRQNGSKGGARGGAGRLRRAGRGAVRHRALGQGEAHVSASALVRLGVRAGRGERVTLDLGAAKVLASLGLSPAALEDALLAALRPDGPASARVSIDGEAVARVLRARGIPVPPGLLPARIAADLPAGEALDLSAAVRATVAALAEGELLRVDAAVVDAVEYAHECRPAPAGCAAVLLLVPCYMRRICLYCERKGTWARTWASGVTRGRAAESGRRSAMWWCSRRGTCSRRSRPRQTAFRSCSCSTSRPCPSRPLCKAAAGLP